VLQLAHTSSSIAPEAEGTVGHTNWHDGPKELWGIQTGMTALADVIDVPANVALQVVQQPPTQGVAITRAHITMQCGCHTLWKHQKQHMQSQQQRQQQLHHYK